MIQTNTTITRDWDRDGYLMIKGATTLRRYSELTNKLYNAPYDELGIFCAFSAKQFDEDYNRLVEQGKIKEGDKLVKYNGFYGTKEAFDQLNDYYDAIHNEIRVNCNPQEVYWREYNNHESFLSWDGDMGAIKVIIDEFGIETARQIKRLDAMYSIDEINK